MNLLVEPRCSESTRNISIGFAAFRASILVMSAAWILGAAGCKTEPAPVVAEPNYAQPLAPGEHALRKVGPDEAWPDLAAAWRVRDPNLRDAIDQSISWFQKPGSKLCFPFHDVLTHEQAAASVVAFQQLLREHQDETAFMGAVHQMFDLWQTKGYDRQGTVLFTGYYSPIFKASLTADSTFKYPLFKRPADLVTEPMTGEPQGRRMSDGSLAPWPTRSEILSSGMLKGTELVYLPSALDTYIIQVNGSAKLEMTDGTTMHIGYAGKTDGAYVGLGQSMLDAGLLTEKELSLQAIENFYEKDPTTVNNFIDRNNCFVFFTQYNGNNWPAGSLGVRVTEKETLATDKKIYPRGGLVFVDTKAINFSNTKESFRRFMLDQDTGGAIVAPGRADIFMGIGPGAEILAGSQYAEGTMYYLLLKPDYVSQYPLPAKKTTASTAVRSSSGQ